jgi:hypothetical protein
MTKKKLRHEQEQQLQSASTAMRAFSTSSAAANKTGRREFSSSASGKNKSAKMSTATMTMP